MKLTAETRILNSLEKIWEFSQEPDLHRRWDLRFTDIEYLPDVDESESQRFRYSTRIGFGFVIEGWGETTGQKDTVRKSLRSSALRFGSDDPKSIVLEGTGSWIYRTTNDSTHFNTLYDYETRHGWVGKLFDDLMFRPLMIWPTRWSFDRLRLWIESKQEPELSFRLWIAGALSFPFLWLASRSDILFIEVGEDIAFELENRIITGSADRTVMTWDRKFHLHPEQGGFTPR